MRIKIRLFLLILLGVLASEVAVAQIVYAEDGYAVIDCRGMPMGAVKSAIELAQSKEAGGRTRRHMQDESNQGGTYIDGTHGTTTIYVNQKVSSKFAVAPADLSAKMSWAAAAGWAVAANGDLSGDTPTAATGCYAYQGNTDDLGDWRLPTHRELKIIYSHKGQLMKTAESSFGSTGFVAFSSASYWSSTEYNSNASWYVNFSNGNVNTDYKSAGYSVRCVRDL